MPVFLSMMERKGAQRWVVKVHWKGGREADYVAGLRTMIFLVRDKGSMSGRRRAVVSKDTFLPSQGKGVPTGEGGLIKNSIEGRHKLRGVLLYEADASHKTKRVETFITVITPQRDNQPTNTEETSYNNGCTRRSTGRRIIRMQSHRNSLD
jgi:hypothetical protein